MTLSNTTLNSVNVYIPSIVIISPLTHQLPTSKIKTIGVEEMMVFTLKNVGCINNYKAKLVYHKLFMYDLHLHHDISTKGVHSLTI